MEQNNNGGMWFTTECTPNNEKIRSISITKRIKRSLSNKCRVCVLLIALAAIAIMLFTIRFML